MPVIAVRFRAKPGRDDDLRRTLLALAEHSRSEDGCIAYAPAESPETPGTFFLYEHWRDEEALEAHRRTAAYRRLAVGDLRDAIEMSEPLRLEPLQPRGAAR